MLGRHVYRVEPDAEGRWIVRKDGEAASVGERASREEALALASRLAEADEPSRVVVEPGDGTLAEERVFGIDEGQIVDGAPREADRER